MPFLKEIIEDELYLYYNGKLIYKRWLTPGYSKVFDLMAYDKYTLSSITEGSTTLKEDKEQLSPNTYKKH